MIAAYREEQLVKLARKLAVSECKAFRALQTGRYEIAARINRRVNSVKLRYWQVL